MVVRGARPNTDWDRVLQGSEPLERDPNPRNIYSQTKFTFLSLKKNTGLIQGVFVLALYFQGENAEPEKSGAGGSGRTRKLKAIQNRLLPSLVHLRRRWLPLVTNPLGLVLDLFLRLPRPRKPKRPEIWAHSRSPLTRARYLSPTFTPPPLPTARQHVDAQNDIRSRCATGREALWAWKMRQSNIWPLRSPP